MFRKKELLFIFAFALGVVLLTFVFAVTVDSPVTGNNFSGTINLSVSTATLANATNATFYYNASGGAATVFLAEIINTSVDQTVFENGSFDISGLTDASTYNISVTIQNLSSNEENSSVSGITIDNTGPNVSIVNTVTHGNYSGTINLNATVADNFLVIDTVFFNITNSSGGQNDTVTLSNPSGSVWNATLNTSNFIDGTYNITAYANDSLNNLNSSEVVHTLTFDNTPPSSIVLSSSSVTETSLSLSVAITDAGSGIGSACSVDRAGASVSGTGASQTVSESSLNCGSDYTYVVTCTDLAGNSNSSSSSTFTTSACSSGTTSGGSSTQTWTNTYIATSEHLSEGYNKEFAAKNRVKVVIDKKNHYVGVLTVTATTAKIQVSSDPVEATLNIGEESKFDVTNDSFYDIFVKLNGITNSKANLTVQQIHEAVPTGEPSAAVTDTNGTTRDATQQEEVTPEALPEQKSSVWLWVIIVVLILLIILGVVFKDKVKEMMGS